MAKIGKKNTESLKKPYKRKHIVWDWDRVDEMMSYGCTGMEIAATIGCHEDTLYNRVLEEKGINYSQYSAEKRAKGVQTLKEVQYRKAIGKQKDADNTMLIWVGKQLAGQKENPTSDTEVPEFAKKFISAIQKHCADDEKSPESEE